MKKLHLLFLSFLKALFEPKFYATTFIIGFIEVIIFGIIALIIANTLPSIFNPIFYSMLAIVFIITPAFLLAEFTYQKYVAKHN